MWNGKYPALFVEGVDAVGKNELVRSIVQYALLSRPSSKVILMNFPQFWFFGHDIRLMLRGAGNDLLSPLSGEDNLRVRASMYAIDRNIASILAQKYLERYPDAFLVSDRGPYSSCVTTGYLIAQNILSPDSIERGIPKKVFAEADEGMFSLFDGMPLLCTVKGQFEDTGLGQRKPLDDYERPEPQVWSQKVYESMNIPEIITKESGKWRDRYILAKEALSAFAKNRFPVVTEEKFNTSENVLLNAYEKGNVVIIGPLELLEYFKVTHKVSRHLKESIAQWIKLSLGIHGLEKRDRKEVLDEVETSIALEIKELVPYFQYDHIEHDNIGRVAIQNILNRVPIITDILERTSGKHMIQFLEGISSVCQFRLPGTHA